MHDVLMSMAKAEHLKREDFGVLAELMPGALAIGAASMQMQVGEFLGAVNAGTLKPLPVLLAMAAHIEAKSAAH